jgi:hypothetical protein
MANAGQSIGCEFFWGLLVLGRLFHYKELPCPK